MSAVGHGLCPELDHISTCEYWILTRNAGTANKNVTLTWDANSCGVTVLSDLRVARYDGISTWQNEGNTATTGTTAAGTVTSGSVVSFSPFTHSSTTIENPLPVELLDFTAKYNGSNAVDLNWATASEINNDYFTVERSPNGIDFAEIIKKNGAGNSTHIINYSSIDKEPLSGVSYYRLKQTDYNGAYKYSNIVSVDIAISGFEIINVASLDNQNVLEVTVNCSNDCTVNFELIDMTGKKVYSLKQNTDGGNVKIIIPTAAFSQGVYMLKAFNGNKLITRKIKL